MRVVMINDCSFVGETLLKYMPNSIRKQHIKRTRSLWDKTFGILYKILRTQSDIYHVHYLLQDCYLTLRLKKGPIIGHAHGSDLRTTMKHRIWGRIVKYNLMNCDRVIVSTPDLLPIARRFRDDVLYLPNLVDTQVFYPKPPIEHSGKKRVLIADACNWITKGTDKAIRALSKIRDDVEVSIIRYGVDFDRTLALANSLGLRLNILPKVPHEKVREYYWNADVVVSTFVGYLPIVPLEAIACGRPVIAYVSSKYPEYRDFPLKDLIEEEELAEAIMGADINLWRKEYEYFEKYHSPDRVVERLLSIYNELIDCKSG
ncbi:MAG: glycosyltransferase [Crenarchaeota archaeon]|nr:glycosyltransferase [Thermoproteota archaeon]